MVANGEARFTKFWGHKTYKTTRGQPRLGCQDRRIALFCPAHFECAKFKTSMNRNVMILIFRWVFLRHCFYLFMPHILKHFWSPRWKSLVAFCDFVKTSFGPNQPAAVIKSLSKSFQDIEGWMSRLRSGSWCSCTHMTCACRVVHVPTWTMCRLFVAAQELLR